MMPRPLRSTLFPYTTLFRSCRTTVGSVCGWASTQRRTRSARSEEHTSELQSHSDLVCRLLLEKKKKVKWDFHHWSKTMQVLSIVGAFPEPFLHGLEGRRLPTRVEFVFFFNDTATTEIYTLSLHDALPI